MATAKEAVEATKPEETMGDMAAAAANRAARMAPRHGRGGPVRPFPFQPPFQIPAPMPPLRCRNTRTRQCGVAQHKPKGGCWAVKRATHRCLPRQIDRICESGAGTKSWTPLQSWHAGSAALAAAALAVTHAAARHFSDCSLAGARSFMMPSVFMLIVDVSNAPPYRRHVQLRGYSTSHHAGEYTVGPQLGPYSR